MSVWAHERGILWAREVGAGVVAAVQPRLPAVFVEAHHDAATQLAAAMGLPDSAAVLRRLHTGRRCFAAWAANQLVAYGWVSQGTECIGEQEREIHLQAAEAYIWDCATLPAYRGQWLYSALLDQIVVQLCGEGVRRFWIGTSLDNQPSLKGFVNAAFRPVVALSYFRLFAICCMWFLGHPTAPVELVAAARLALLKDRERLWGALAVSLAPRAPLAACAQLEG